MISPVIIEPVKITWTNLTVYKPEDKQKAGKISCAFCSLQGRSWCKKCLAPLCADHIRPHLSEFPYKRILMFDGDEVFCTHHAPPTIVEGYVE